MHDVELSQIDNLMKQEQTVNRPKNIKQINT